MEFLNSNSNYQLVKPSKLKRNILIGLAVVFVLGAAGTAAYFYRQYSNIKNNPGQIVIADNQALIEAVGKLIVLPTDEEPTIATVTDPSKLSDQAFFARAKVGDKVLLYAAAKKAILYDPVANKIVEVAPINLDDANAPSVSGGTETNATN